MPPLQKVVLPPSDTFKMQEKKKHFRSRLESAIGNVTVEPVMFLFGTCHWSMQVFMEIVQMNKVCLVGLNLPPEICSNLSGHPEENIEVQKYYSVFALQNSIILSALSLIFVLFMGAWSDIYGRKIPLVMATLCHVLWSGGYLLNSWQTHWPLEYIYVVTFLDSLGGGGQGLISATVAYISDVTPAKSRTSRVSTAMSLWYIGGPLGNLIGAVALQTHGINLAISIAFAVHLGTTVYTIFHIKESHGPFAVESITSNCPKSASVLKKEDVTKTKMVTDFFNWRRVVETFKTAFRKREGRTRSILIAVIVSNMVRRAAKGLFMYLFVRRALNWDAPMYTYWMSYRTLVMALGSLVFVPLLVRTISIADPLLIVVGSLSLIGECCCFGLVSSPAMSFFLWIGPLAGFLTNASMIAQKSLSTKLVSASEKGRITAVISATQSLMPTVGYAMYAPLYRLTVATFPEAQFFFGASLGTIIMIVFLVIHLTNIVPNEKNSDAENNMPKAEEKTGEENKGEKEANKSSSSTDAQESLSVEATEHEVTPSIVSASEGGKALYIEYICPPRDQGVDEAIGVAKEENTTQDECKRSNKCYENKLTDEEILASENTDNCSSSREKETDR